jgi:hypothetical protein
MPGEREPHFWSAITRQIAYQGCWEISASSPPNWRITSAGIRAAEVARRLSGHLDAPLVLSGYSRLAVDCNRPLDSPESITEQSAGVSVPEESGAHG